MMGVGGEVEAQCLKVGRIKLDDCGKIGLYAK
jgi:hypothetical protein